MINDNMPNVRNKALEAIVAAIVLTMVAAVLMSPVNAEGDTVSASDDDKDGKMFEWGDYTFKIESQESLTASIFLYSGNAADVEVPSAVQHNYWIYSIVAIDDLAFSKTGIVSISIPEGVTEIRDNVFSGCSKLTTVEMPSTLTSIGDRAFYSCESLKSIEIPSSVQKIGSGVFEKDINLTDVVLPKGINEISESMFNECYSLCVLDIPASVVKIGDYAFVSTGFTSITLPDSVKEIGDGAFLGASLKYLKCPMSLTCIGQSAFLFCSYMTGITFNDGLKSIGQNAFVGCSSLGSIKMPDSVSEIGSNAFAGCTSIEYVELGAGAAFVAGMFSDSPVKMYFLSNNCKAYVVEDGVLYSSNMYTLLAYPAAKGGSSFEVPRAVSAIGDKAFSGNCYIESVSGLNVTKMGDNAFDGCISLKSVDFPNIQEIGSYAFYMCKGLSSYEIPESVNSIGTAAFASSGIVAFKVADKNDDFAVADGVLYNKSMTELIEFPCRSADTFTIPDSVTKIGEGAFIQSAVSEVKIPSSVVTIGEKAFYMSSIKTVTIPATVKYIESYAFASTQSLTKAVIETATAELGGSLFYTSSVKDVVFSEGVTTIAEKMFVFDRNLKEIVLPETVSVIMCDAFSGIAIDYVYIPAKALVHEDAFGDTVFTDAAGKKLAYNELAGYAYKADKDGVLVRQGYSVVSFDENGGSEPAPESFTVANGFEITLPDYEGIKAEYEFSGWYCEEKIYAVGEKVKVMTNMEFVAVWYKDAIEISFDITGGKADIGSFKTDIGSSYSVNGNIMTVTSGLVTKTITVKGDYSSSAIVVWESESGYFTEDTVVKAAFPQYSVAAVCDEQYGKVSAPSTAFEGQTVTLKAEPKKGYVNTGWEEKDGLVTIKDSKFVMPASDVTVVGLFDVAYTITIKTVSGGTALADYDEAAAGTTVTLSAYADTDYTFKSWTVSPKVTVKDDKFVMPESDVTITPAFTFAGTKTAEVENGKVVFTADSDIKENTKITLSITKVKSPKQTNLPSDAVVYSIKATATTDGKAVDLSDKKATVTIYVDLKDAEKNVFYVSDDGKTVENMNAGYDAVEGGLVFNTTHFSDFAITEKNIDPVKDNTMMYIIIAAIILIVVIAVICIAWRVKLNKARP